MKNIEVEIRSFITKKKYGELLKFFKENSNLVKEDYQETFYFDCVNDLRIQKNDFFAKVWLKKGKIHDAYREEIQIKFGKKDFEKLEELFLILGYETEIKWFRKRFEFEWEGINVCLDFTRGYGYIIEFEKVTSGDNQEKVLKELEEKIKVFNIDITSREEFEKKFLEYKKNWRDLVLKR